ncbi:MAG: tetratricopeptide repeat protein [Ignavibacteria bacterium]|nr:tetratricopeptide repeat protein [Ignavibacteria bacterium]
MQNLVPDFILNNYKNNILKGEMDAFTMFIDISGFTSLTENLMQGGNEGAEVLSDILKNIFKSTVNHVYEYGGFISTFAGDAFTSIFPLLQDQSHFTQAQNIVLCAEKILQRFKENPVQKTKFGSFEFGVSIGLSTGIVKWAIVGSKDKSFYFMGNAIDNCALSENAGSINEIIIDERIKQHLKSEGIELKQTESNFFKLQGVKIANTKLSIHKTGTSHLGFTKEIFSKKFFSEAVFKVKEPGEFRNVVSVFISFDGITENNELNKFFTILIDSINFYSGYIENFDFGDKGGVIPCFFGAPISYEDNLTRALNFISTTKQKTFDDSLLNNLKYRIGITFGKVYAGIIGGDERNQYTMLGSKVNLAARFMMTANWGEVWTDEKIYQKLKEEYYFEKQPEQNFKGYKDKITPYRLIDEQEEKFTDLNTSAIVGRDTELKKMMSFIKTIFKNRFAGVVYINGEIGIGKTRLIDEFRKKLVEANTIRWLYCPNEEIIRQPLNPFKYFLTNYFKQSLNNSIEENKNAFNREVDLLISKLQETLHANKNKSEDITHISNELERTRSILGAMVDLHWEDSLYEQLDPQLRFENTLFAFYNLIIAGCLLQPVIIEIEDAQWLDNDSKELLNVLARNISDLPLAIVISSRYLEDGSKFSLNLDSSIPHCDIELEYLSLEGTKSLTEQLLDDKIDESSAMFLKEKTNGNPFFIEQLILDFKEREYWKKRNEVFTLEIADTHIKEGKRTPFSLTTEETIPSTINSVLLSRFDRLTSEIKEVVQTASVLGKEFEIQVITQMLKDVDDLLTKIKAAEKKQIWAVIEELKCVYKHTLLRDVVYNMQMRARLRELHLLAANSIMKLSGDAFTLKTLEQYGYHFGVGNNIINENNLITLTKELLSDNKDAVIEYLNLQKDLANKYKKNYNNEETIEKCEQVITIAEMLGDFKIETEYMVIKGSVLQLTGKFDEAQNVFKKSLRKAENNNDLSNMGKSYSALGRVREDKGDYELAISFQEKAIHLFEKIQDKTGLASSIGSLGDIYYEKGDYNKAMNFYSKQLLINKEAGNKKGIHIAVESMGDVLKEQGDYNHALKYLGKSLKILEEFDDKIGISMTIGNMGNVYYDKGDLANAIKCYEKQLMICESLGYKKGISAALGNLGTIFIEKNDFKQALKYLGRSLKILEELGDKAGITMVVGNIGNLYVNKGKLEKAMIYYEKQLKICKELGHKRGIAIALGNIGIVHTELGSYEQALEYLKNSLEILNELGSKRIISINLGNVGNVHKEKNEYDKAIKCYDEAILICNEIGASYNLIHILIEKAEVLFLQKKYRQANKLISEVIKKPVDKGSNDNIFKANLLLHKTEYFIESKEKSIVQLQKLFNTTNEEKDIADLHYELYQLLTINEDNIVDKNQLDEHRKESLKMYKKIYRITKAFKYKKRIGGLTSKKD